MDRVSQNGYSFCAMARWAGCSLKAFAVSIALVWASGCASVHSSANVDAELRPQATEKSTQESARTSSTSTASYHPAMVTLDLPSRREDSVGDPPYTEPLFSKEYGSLLGQDTRYVLTAPLHWEKREWLWFSVATVGLAGMTFLDRAFSEIVQRNHNDVTDAISRNIDPFGAEYSAGVLGAFYLGGALFDNPKARAVAQDGLASSLIASGIIVPTMKLTFGRSRHEQNQGPHDFDPFNPHYTSFPSGHTTQAFAVASVIAAHYESMWVKATAFGAASIVGYARIQRNKHWATDVAAGAVIGTLVGNSVVHFNQSRRSHHVQPKISLAPLFDGEMVGIVASRPF